MKRHLLVGRYGVGDTANIPQAGDEILNSLPLLAGTKTLNFGLQQAVNDLEKLNVYPSEVGLDLLVLAAHVYAADTRISRKTESQDGWTREMRLVIPVSDVQRWNSVASLLSQMLNFLTGDIWKIGFRKRSDGFQKIVPESQVDLLGSQFDGVNLFSGGLDSLIGAIDSLEKKENVLLVSHAAEGAVSDSQNTIFAMLKNKYNGETFDRLRFWFNIPKNQLLGLESEDSTRGRSFLFFSLGVFAGTGLGQPFTLKVPENGLIALNVPLDPLRLGSLSTRTTHPFYMARWNDLIAGLGIDGSIVNPYWIKTKGEMISECENIDFLKTILPHSMSCSSPTKGRWKGKGVEHCGYCLPCLIRRASIEGALGADNDPSGYTVDVRSGSKLSTSSAEGKQVRSFQIAIDRLSKRPELAKFLIHKSGSLSDETGHLDELAAVYSRGMHEMAELLSGVKT